MGVAGGLRALGVGGGGEEGPPPQTYLPARTFIGFIYFARPYPPGRYLFVPLKWAQVRSGSVGHSGFWAG